MLFFDQFLHTMFSFFIITTFKIVPDLYYQCITDMSIFITSELT
jgi:hypothetical protein